MAGIRKPAISPVVKQQIIFDFHNHAMSCYALGKKYGVAANTAKSIVKNNPPTFRAPESLVWKPLQTRARLDSAQRMQKLNEDAICVVELTFQAMIQTLQTCPEKINIREQTAFLTAAAPYVMPRMEARKSIPTPMGKRSNTMFRDEVMDYDLSDFNTLEDE